MRELGVYCEIYPWDIADVEVRAFKPSGVILSGGPESVTDARTRGTADGVYPRCTRVGDLLWHADHDATAWWAGRRLYEREFGYAEVTVPKLCRLLDDIGDRRDSNGRAVLDVWMSHGDRVDSLPEGFVVTATTDSIPFAAMTDEKRRFYGVQFHPEVTHTPRVRGCWSGSSRDFGCDAFWSVGNIIQDAIDRVRAQVGKGKVLLGCPVVSTRLLSLPCCIERLVINWCAFSSTMACCGWGRATR